MRESLTSQPFFLIVGLAQEEHEYDVIDSSCNPFSMFLKLAKQHLKVFFHQGIITAESIL